MRARKTREKMLTGKVMLNSVQMQMQMQICASRRPVFMCIYHWVFRSFTTGHRGARIVDVDCIEGYRIVLTPSLPPPYTHTCANLDPSARAATIKVAGVMQKSSEILQSMNKCVPSRFVSIYLFIYLHLLIIY